MPERPTIKAGDPGCQADQDARLLKENELLWAAFNAAEILFCSLAPKDAPIKVPTQTLIDINNLGHAIVAVREHTRAVRKDDRAQIEVADLP